MTPNSVTIEPSSAAVTVTPAALQLTVSSAPAASVAVQQSPIGSIAFAGQVVPQGANALIELTCQPTSFRSDVLVLTPNPMIEVRANALPSITITTSEQGPPGVGAGGALDAAVISAVDVGAIAAGDVVAEGTTLTGFVQRLLLKTFYPSFTAPSASLSASMASQVEVGTIGDLTLTASLSRGAILGAMVGGTWNTGATQAPRAGPLVSAVIEGQATAGSLTLPAYQVVEGGNGFTAQLYHDEGVQPVDSEGQPFNSPLPAGSLSTSRTFYGRRRLFHGTPGATPTDSTSVRSLSGSTLNPANGTSFTIAIPAGASFVTFAYPSALRAVSTVKYVEGLNSEVKGVFTEQSVQVAGANGYSPVSYRVYTFVPAEPFPESATYNVTI